MSYVEMSSGASGGDISVVDMVESYIESIVVALLTSDYETIITSKPAELWGFVPRTVSAIYRGRTDSTVPIAIGIKFKKQIKIRAIEVNDWGRSTPLKYQASNDGSNWTDLYSKNGKNDTNPYYHSPSGEKYQYYRIYVAAKNTDDAAVLSNPRIFL